MEFVDQLGHYALVINYFYFVSLQDQATEVILTLGEAFEVAYQMALKEHSGGGTSCNGHARSHSTSSSSNTLKKNNFVNHADTLRVTSSTGASVTTPTSANLNKYFVRNKDGRIPMATLLAEAKFQEIKRLLEIEGASDAKMFKRLVLCIGNSDFRALHRVEKEVADEIFALVVHELNYRSENFTQLEKYYRSSYGTNRLSLVMSSSSTLVSKIEPTKNTNALNQYFIRDKDFRIPLWTMVIEERFDDLRKALQAAPSLSEVEILKLVASNMAAKTFREMHGISREVADEVFECVADELMTREGTMAQLLDHYNKSFN